MRLLVVAPPRRVKEICDRKRRQRLAVTEGDVEERGRVRQTARTAGVGGVGHGARNQVAVVADVPQPHAGGEAHRRSAGVPVGVRHQDLDLAPAEVHVYPGGETAHRLAARVEQIGDEPVPGQEQPPRRGRVGAVRKRHRRPRAADHDRRRHPLGIDQRVQREPKRGGIPEWPQAELDEVGGIGVVPRPRGIRIGAVRFRERVDGLREARRGARVGGVRLSARTVIVEQEVLVEVLAVAVGAGARDEDRRSTPDPRVLELGGAGPRPVENRRSWPGARSAVERRAIRPRRPARHRAGDDRRQGRGGGGRPHAGTAASDRHRYIQARVRCGCQGPAISSISAGAGSAGRP